MDVDSDDENLSSSIVAQRIFQLQEEDDSKGVDPKLERYLVVVPNVLQFTLVVKYICADLSFQQCCKVLLDTKETTYLGQIGCINMRKVNTYTRFVCAMAYQMIADVLKSVWAFSIAMDCLDFV